MHKNNVPSVIEALEDWVLDKKTRTYIPPAFYDRDGSFIQPPTFEMQAYVRKNSKGPNTTKWFGDDEKSAKIEEGRQ